MNSFYYNKTTNKWEPFGYNISLDEAPIGTKIDYAGNEVPEGYLKADGSLVKKADYPELFDIIGYTYGGSGDEFKLPDSGDSSSGGSVVSGVAGITAFESDENMWDYMETTPARFNPTIQSTDLIISNFIFDEDFSIFTVKNYVGLKFLEYFRSPDIFKIPETQPTYGFLISSGKIYKNKGTYLIANNSLANVFKYTGQTIAVHPISQFNGCVFGIESKYICQASPSSPTLLVGELKPEGLALQQTVLYTHTFPQALTASEVSSLYIAYDYLKVGDKCFKITDTALVPSDKNLPKTFTPTITPTHNYAKDPFIITSPTSPNIVFDINNNKEIVIPDYYKIIGFIGSSNYLLLSTTDPVKFKGLYLFDVKTGTRIIKLKPNYIPLNITTKGKYTYILHSVETAYGKWSYDYMINHSSYITRIPTKFLTGDNFKDNK